MVKGARRVDAAHRSKVPLKGTPGISNGRSRGRSNGIPYTLRHSFRSLLLHEGRSVPYVARQMGHGAQLTLSTYGHVIDELDGQEHAQAEDLKIGRASCRERV